MAGYEYGGVCDSWVYMIECSTLPYHTRTGPTFYPSLLLKFKFYPTPTQSFQSTAAQCFTLHLLKPWERSGSVVECLTRD